MSTLRSPHPSLAPRIFSALLVMLLHVAAPAQTAPTAPPKLQVRPAADQRLLFDVVAHRRTGETGESLTADKLRVRLDGKLLPAGELTVVQEHHPEIVFVLDAINCSREDLVRSQGALVEWLRSAGERLPFQTSILIVADVKPQFSNMAGGSAGTVASWELLKDELYVARLTPTHNSTELIAKLNSYRPGLSRLGTALQTISGGERVHISLQALSFFAAAVQDAPTPKLVLWISPGWPFVHMTEGGYAGQLFDSIVYFDNLLRSARVVLYALDPTGAATDHTAPPEGALLATRPGVGAQRGGSLYFPTAPAAAEYYKTFLAPVRSAKSADPNDMVLPVLALHSGGTVQLNSNDLLGGIAHFASDAEALYSVAFPASKATGQDAFHALKLDVPGSDGAARTRIGFYAR